jgi:hypothetical protein
MLKQIFLFIVISFPAYILGAQEDIYLNHKDDIFNLYERINSGERLTSEIDSAISSLEQDWANKYSGSDSKLTRGQCAFWIAAHHLRVYVAMNHPEYMHSALRRIFDKWNNENWTDEELSRCRTFEPDFIAVSIVQLLTAPEKFQGKLITVRGVLASHFEGSNLFLSRDSYNFVDIASSIQVSGESITEELDGQSVWVRGRFFEKNCMNSIINTGCLKFVTIIRQDMDNYRKSIRTVDQP